jgi:hypothetical protein
MEEALQRQAEDGETAEAKQNRATPPETARPDPGGEAEGQSP